jgi:hypothetical protein
MLEKMDKRMIGVVVGALVLILLFTTIGSAIRQAGWNEGYTIGLLASGKEGSQALAPYLAHRGGYGMHHIGFGFLGFFGFFFKLIFFVFLFGLFFKVLGFGGWRQGWHGHPWAHHDWRTHHAPWPAGHQAPTPAPESPKANPPSSEPPVTNV